MIIDWEQAFSLADHATKIYDNTNPLHIASLGKLKEYLDFVHIKHCLIKPYLASAHYPVVEAREFIPSFEPEWHEHKELPGFSLIALARPIVPFTEVFQFDWLLPTHKGLRSDIAQKNLYANFALLQSRLPRQLLEDFCQQCAGMDVTDLSSYKEILPTLLAMDRAQVFGLQGPHPQQMSFSLAGVHASFPSDLDAEVKRYGLRIGKFHFAQPELYEENRAFVLQHLMEIYGYPVASERRTSAALFARRLHKMGERFLIRTLGQSDRTLHTIWNAGAPTAYPAVEKIALVRVEDTSSEVYKTLHEQGYFLDADNSTVILRVSYQQHKFSADNVQQERAISIASQEVIHPLTGTVLSHVNVLREHSHMFLRLNDIVRGEYTGTIFYKRHELVINTDTDEKRLKFIYAWLTKHQRRIIGYSEEYYLNIKKVLDSYLFSAANHERLSTFPVLLQEVIKQYSYIQQARKVHQLTKVASRKVKNGHITYEQMLREAVSILHELKFEIVSYFDTLASTAIHIGEAMLNDRYLLRTYIEKTEDALTPTGIEIKKLYGKLVTLIDELNAIRKSRVETG